MCHGGLVKCLPMWRSILRLGIAQLAAMHLACPAQPPQDCAGTLAALARLDETLLLAWRETSMTDGKPLVLNFSDGPEGLRLHMHKTGEGLWASGPARVCRRGTVLEARLSAAVHGPAAPWLLRRMAGESPVFVLHRAQPGELTVSTPGWRGTFVAGR